jgi:hypothetical protein
MKNTFVLFFLLIAPITVLAQTANEDIEEDTESAAIASINSPVRTPPKLFINCVRTNCYTDYLRTQLAFFDFVRDRYVSDIEVLVTNLRTGTGGQQYTLSFYGHNRFDGLNDTLRFVTNQSDSDDQIRTQLVRTCKQGLVRYLLDTDFMQQVNIGLPARQTVAQRATQPKDPWKLWVFRIGGDGSARGESNKKYLSFSTYLRINRITTRSKFSFRTYYNDNRSNYTVDGENIRVRTVDYGLSSLYVKSISQHWSVGGFYRAYHSIYRNTDVSQSVAPALEYSFFPVSQVTRHQFRAVYQVGVRSLRYIEPTIYDKMQELLPYHQLTGVFSVTQPWGTLSAHITLYQYLHDLSKNRLSVNMNASWRIIQGLSILVTGRASLINNQISLARSTIDPDQALLNGRQLPTNFNYYTSMGLNYTFGSINNSVINPRFSNVD